MTNSLRGDAGWVSLLRPGDLVVVAQGAGEPSQLLGQLLDESSNVPDLQVFVGLSHTGALEVPREHLPELLSFGAMGPLGALAKVGAVGVIPCNFVDVPRALRARAGRRLVVLMQVSAAGDGRNHSLGMAVDYTYELADEAALVVAEINDQLPATSAPVLARDRIDVAIPTSRPLPQVRSRPPTAVQRRIAAHAAALVPDGAMLQLGVGVLASAVGEQLVGRRNLRVHSPLVGDWLAVLSQAGALSRARNSLRTCEAAGTTELYELVAAGDVSVCPVRELTDAQFDPPVEALVAMNSALQVDLSGQANAEQIDGRFIGAIGGQADMMRAAQKSPGGLSVLMLPSCTKDGRSRIVAHLDCGVVTSARAIVDFVVTEHGAADLRGRTLAERATAIMAVAAPEHRASLDEALRRP